MFPDRFIRFAREHDPSWRGFRFVCMGLFAALVTAGYADGWPFSELWRPLPITAAFLASFSAFLWFGGYYERNFWPARDRLDASGDRSRAAFWAALGGALAAVVFLGAWAGYAPNAAGIAVAAWLLAYRAVHGGMWPYYATVAWGLLAIETAAPACELLLGLAASDSELYSVIMLGEAALVLVMSGAIDHGYIRAIRRNRFGGEGL